MGSVHSSAARFNSSEARRGRLSFSSRSGLPSVQALASAAIPHRLGESTRSGHSIDYLFGPNGAGTGSGPEMFGHYSILFSQVASNQYYQTLSYSYRLFIIEIGFRPQHLGSAARFIVCWDWVGVFGLHKVRLVHRTNAGPPWSEGRRTSARPLYIGILCGVQVGQDQRRIGACTSVSIVVSSCH